MDLSFTKSEVSWIILAIALFEFVMIFPNKIFNPFILLTPILIILGTVFAKKIAASVYNIKITHKIWEFQRYGFPEKSKLKKPFPIGILFSFIISLITIGLIKTFIFLQFDEENIPKKRLLRRHGIERRAEISEGDISSTAAWGFYALLFIAAIGTIPAINMIFPQLTKFSIYFGFWNLLPISNLDGSKLFFGSRPAWFTLAVVFIISLCLVWVYL